MIASDKYLMDDFVQALKNEREMAEAAEAAAQEMAARLDRLAHHLTVLRDWPSMVAQIPIPIRCRTRRQ